MKAARIAPIVLLLLVAVLATSCQTGTRASSSTAPAAITGTGPSSTTATTAPLPTTSSETPTTADMGDTEPPTENTLAASPDVVKYASEVVAWFFLQGETIGYDLDRLADIDVTKMSASDLQVVERATAHLQTLSNILRSIKVPAEAAGVHKKLVAYLDARFAIMDKELMAMRNKDQAGVDAAGEARAWGGPEALRSAGEEWWGKYGEIGGWRSESPPFALPKTPYQAGVMAWVKAFRVWANNGSGGEMTVEAWAVTITDPAQVARAHGFGDQLRAIEPPAAMAAVHQKLVGAFDAWLAVLDEQLAAGKDPDQATLDPVETEYTGAMQDWLIAQFPSVPLPLE
jgi:hypothetical protein